MTRLLLAAVVVLVAVAAADAIRPDGKERTVSAAPARSAAQPAVQRSSSGYIAVGAFTRKRVLHHGREYLSTEAIDAAFDHSHWRDHLPRRAASGPRIDAAPG